MIKYRNEKEIEDMIQKIENLFQNTELNKEDASYFIGILKGITWMIKLKDDNYIFNKFRG